MVSKYIKESTLIQESFDCDFVNLSTSRTMDEIGKGGLKKIFRFLGSLFTLLGKLLTHRYDLCYIAITCHGMGFLKDAPFALLCKLFGRKLLLHQHNKGMSRDCNRWPYRWLMPLVYRNATVMLLSWNLYPDISAVVKREQVVVCANGVPPLDNENLAAELRATINVERGARGHACVYDNDNENDNLFKSTEFILGQQNLDTNSQNARIASLACGHPDEMSNLTQTTQKTQNISINADNDTNIDSNSQNAHTQACACHPDEINENVNVDANNSQFTIDNSQLTISTEGAHPQPSSIDLSCQRDNTEFRHDDACCARVGLPDGNCPPRLGGRAEERSDRAEGVYSKHYTLNSKLNAEPRLLFLSNLIVSKGIYVLLEACQRLKEQGVAFHCDYVGGESKEVTGEQFRKAIAERGLEDCVIYHGPQYGADKDRAFRRADIFVQPTFDDCFPLTLVEAMQYRLPIVSTDVGAIPDIVTDGVNGLVCKQQDVDSLVEALTTLLADAALRREMGERGHARYLKEMTLEVFERSFAELLKSVVCSV